MIDTYTYQKKIHTNYAKSIKRYNTENNYTHIEDKNMEFDKDGKAILSKRRTIKITKERATVDVLEEKQAEVLKTRKITRWNGGIKIEEGI